MPEAGRTIVATPVQEYTHPEYENRITLVGMIHVAQFPYFRAIQDIIDERERDGATVHYEMVADVRPEGAQAPQQDVEKADRLKSTMLAIYGWFKDSGLVLQTESLEYKSHWENHDSTLLELVGAMSNLSVRRLSGIVGLYDRLFNNMKPAEQQKFVLKFAESIEKSMARDHQANWLSRVLLGNLQRPLLDYRNEIALEAIDRSMETGSVSDFALIWGAAHLRGLGQGLVRRGYEKSDQYQVNAIDTALLGSANV